MPRLLRIVLALVPIVLFSNAVQAEQLTATYTATSGCCASDLNNDLNPGSRGLAEGRSSLGQFKMKVILDIDPANIQPALGLCSSETSVRVFCFGGSAVMTFRDGSMLFKELATDGRESFACFDFVAQRTTSTQISWSVAGGTKRFSNAQGASVARATLHELPGQVALTAEESGEIDF